MAAEKIWERGGGTDCGCLTVGVSSSEGYGQRSQRKVRAKEGARDGRWSLERKGNTRATI